MTDANGDQIERGDIVLIEATVERDFGSAFEVLLSDGKTRAFIRPRHLTKKPLPPDRDLSSVPLFLPATA